MKRSHWQSSGTLAVLGTGLVLPGEPITTEALLDCLGPELDSRRRALAAAIAARMGIKTRYVARSWHARVEAPAAGCSNPDLAAAAVRAALSNAGLRPSDLGYLIAHTATPAQPLPSNVAFVADRLDYHGPHIELRQACTGFANALMIAFGLLTQPGAPPVAIVGSETGSVFFDPDASSARPDQIVNLVQMGDGAGAIVLGAAGTGPDALYGAWFGATGAGRGPGLQMRAGGSDCPSGGCGPLLFDHDFAAIAQAGAALFEAGMAASPMLSPAAADYVIPHQANGRIGEQLSRRFGLPTSRFVVNADRVGNTGSAAIWIALAELRARHLSPGTRTLVLGAEATKYMHGGFAFAAG
jgi:3-oxoacyl-[acyl-carrier-protein] synthase-3